MKKEGNHLSAYSDLIKQELLSILHNSKGLIVKGVGEGIAVSYMSGMVDTAQLNLHILGRLPHHKQAVTLEQVQDIVNIGDCQIIEQLEDGMEKLLNGFALCTVVGYSGGVLMNVINIPAKSPGTAEKETVLYGPMIAFTENMDKNIALVRSYITNPNLVQETVKVGKKTHTIVNLLYMHQEGGNPFAELAKQRFSEFQGDGFIGSAMTLHILKDQHFSIFPEMSLTELPDKTSQALLEGKVVVMVEGNSQVLIGPNSFFDFYHSTEDRYSPLGIGTFFRVLRLLGLVMSIYLTPLYVAALTFHYEVIPMTLLVPLISSRARVPYPPLIECLILEVAMSLLREASARLPTKVAQTMGIVGAIVIGQAAVEAGLTSNVLILLIAFAALGSYTNPNYMMSGSSRVIRYPFILVAGYFGFIGIAFLTAVLAIHLLRMTSLGKPYLFPLYPVNKDGIYRGLIMSQRSAFQYKSDLTSMNGKGTVRKRIHHFLSKDHDE